jgi:hypothetical protein
MPSRVVCPGHTPSSTSDRPHLRAPCRPRAGHRAPSRQRQAATARDRKPTRPSCLRRPPLGGRAPLAGRTLWPRARGRLAHVGSQGAAPLAQVPAPTVGTAASCREPRARAPQAESKLRRRGPAAGGPCTATSCGHECLGGPRPATSEQHRGRAPWPTAPLPPPSAKLARGHIPLDGPLASRARRTACPLTGRRALRGGRAPCRTSHGLHGHLLLSCLSS